MSKLIVNGIFIKEINFRSKIDIGVRFYQDLDVHPVLNMLNTTKLAGSIINLLSILESLERTDRKKGSWCDKFSIY